MRPRGEAGPIRALLFDLGGVVVDVDFERTLSHWEKASRHPPARLRELFHFDAPYQAHETGHLAANEYFAHVRELMALDGDDAFIEAGWNAVFVAPIAPTVSLIERVRSRLPCYALSNTNPTHIAAYDKMCPGTLGLFEQAFFSHDIGFRKPHPSSFAYALERMGVDAPEVLFFDDLADNVDAARALGLQAALVRSPEDVRGELAARGLA
ncbi:HAD family hydrolase [Ramlibacter sp.]|uniref:HAD family hydrolase n=1 Tax=Ramlibacter sp. TaxID=1917967 RepID=UPI003D0C92EE